jgi:RNA polymerase sigma-70 factor, ECF subfamily
VTALVERTGPVDDSTSLSLLERVRHQDSQAWQRLVYLYTPLVHHWCQSWGLFGPDADDVRQVVFQSVATGLANFRRERAGDTFRGWLRVITRRKLLDHRQRRERQPIAEGGSTALQRLEQVAQPEPDEADDPPAEVKRLYHRALELIRSQFEERTWQAFWRVVIEDHSPTEVAVDMGITANAVRQAKSRVLRRLKEEMGELIA